MYVNHTYYVIYVTNVGRAPPHQWLGPTRADCTNLAQRVRTFKGRFIPSEGGGLKEYLPAARLSQYCVNCVILFVSTLSAFRFLIYGCFVSMCGVIGEIPQVK